MDKHTPTQFGRAMRQLGIEMIAAYSPEARGRSERMFGTHKGRLPQELAAANITTIKAANRYLREMYLPAFNVEFKQPAMEEGSAFIPDIGHALDDTLCEKYDRVIVNNNCVAFEGRTLQIPRDQARHHYVKVKVRVHRYVNGNLAVFNGPRKLAVYDSNGNLMISKQKDAA